MKNDETPRIELTPVRRKAGAVQVRTAIKAGPTRRVELDHVGTYNFMVEISGVNAGYHRGPS